MKLTPHEFKIGDTGWVYCKDSGFHQKLIQYDEQLQFEYFFETKAEAILDQLQESINWTNKLIWILQEELNHD